MILKIKARLQASPPGYPGSVDITRVLSKNHPDAKFIGPHGKRSDVMQSHLRRPGVRSKTAANGD